MKKSTVTDIQSKKPWDSEKYGRMYQFLITMENGDEGEYTSKKENQTFFEVGKEVQYTFIPGEYPKIKPVYEKPFNNNFRSLDSQTAMTKSVALKAAAIFESGRKDSTVASVMETSNMFIKYLENKENNIDKKDETKEKREDNDLPF
jgi:hypothetical protein